MKSSAVVAVLAAVLGFSSFANAQNEGRLSTRLEPKKRVSVEILGTPLLLKGFGAAVGYSLTPKLNVQGFGETFVLDSNDDEKTISFFKIRNELTRVGARADLYPLSTVDRGGWYVSGGLVQTSVVSKVESAWIGNNEASASKFGLLALTGYTFRGGLLRQASMLVKLGLGYGTGAGVSTTVGSLSGTKTEVKDAALIDLNIGMMF